MVRVWAINICCVGVFHTMMSQVVSLRPPLRALHSGVRTAAHITTSSAAAPEVGKDAIPAVCGTAFREGAMWSRILLMRADIYKTARVYRCMYEWLWAYVCMGAWVYTWVYGYMGVKQQEFVSAENMGNQTKSTLAHQDTYTPVHKDI